MEDLDVTRSIVRRVVTGVATFALAAALSVVGAQAAQAAPQDYCGSGKGCVWASPGYVSSGHADDYVGWYQCVYALGGLGFVYGGPASTGVSWYNNGNYDRLWMYEQRGYAWSSNGTYPRFYLDKKTGDGDIRNSAGYVQNISYNSNSTKFESVSTSCT